MPQRAASSASSSVGADSISTSARFQELGSQYGGGGGASSASAYGYGEGDSDGEHRHYYRSDVRDGRGDGAQ